MNHPIIARMKWPDLMRRADDIKSVDRSIKGRLERASSEVVNSGILAEIKQGQCHAD